ncbi:Hpt domain-containing protein [Peristeroidobacter soli]|jgi:chemotaxis protein histidine kinase CheA|uniref:Hpt domain-containing protein n=1 Tax=Peristeroidobacter soli TaxID=2497877 RepID=UPI00101C1C6D|nr:Hpt domain-containing protein [Peristeroidobacter soli]
MSHSADARPGSALSTDVLDSAVFEDLLQSLAAPAAVAAIYCKFLGNAATFIRELASQDVSARVETMHTLKGSAAMLGANRISTIAAQLQKDLHGSIVQVDSVVRELEGELAKFREAAAERLLAAGATLDL